MGKQAVYRCENEFGDNACQWAKEDREILESEAKEALDGAFKCPECGSELIFEGYRGEGGQKKALMAGVAVLVVLVIASGGWAIWKNFPPGTPQISVETATLVFSGGGDGETKAGLRIRNTGDADLVIKQIKLEPDVFSVLEREVRVEPGKGETVIVSFKSASINMIQGKLMLYSNAQEEPLTVRLIANQDPWWVYQKLEKTSNILSIE